MLCSESQQNTSLSGRRLSGGTTNGREENGDDDDEPPAGGQAKVKRRSAWHAGDAFTERWENFLLLLFVINLENMHIKSWSFLIGSHRPNSFSFHALDAFQNSPQTPSERYFKNSAMF